MEGEMDDNILHASAGGSDPVAYILQNNRYGVTLVFRAA